MRRFTALIFVALASTASAAPRTKVAVMEVKNVQGVPEGTATILTEIVVSEVARYGMEVVSKSDIAAIVGFEKQKTLLGCSEDSSCLAEIGGALGVDYMLTGQVGQIGSRYRLSLLLVDVKKGKVAGRAADFCDKNEDALANATQTRVREIIGAIQTAVAGASERSAAAAAARTGAAGAKQPSPATAATPPSPAPQAAQLPAPPEEPPSPGAWSRKKILGVSLTGGGGLMLIGGVVMGLKAKSLDSDLAKASNNLGFYYDYPAKRDQVKRTALIADVLYGLGFATAGVGGYLWFTDKPAAIAVVPVVGDGQAGLVAMGRF
jgi:TolB-like protein